MTCQSPRDTLTGISGMWGNLVTTSGSLSGQHTNKISCIQHPSYYCILIQEKGPLITAADNSGLVHIF